MSRGTNESLWHYYSERVMNARGYRGKKYWAKEYVSILVYRLGRKIAKLSGRADPWLGD